ERRTKTRKVRAAVDGVDVVGEGIDLLVVAVVVLNRHFDRKTVRFSLEIDRLVVQRGLVLVQVLYELCNTALVVKLVRPLGFLTFVFDRDADSLVEKCFLTQTL